MFPNRAIAMQYLNRNLILLLHTSLRCKFFYFYRIRDDRSGQNSTLTGGKSMEWKYMKGISIEAQYLYRKGMEMEEKGNLAAALAYFRQAVLLAPSYARAIFEMGNCLAGLGRSDEAQAKYVKAGKIDPVFTAPPVAAGMQRGSGPVQQGL